MVRLDISVKTAGNVLKELFQLALEVLNFLFVQLFGFGHLLECNDLVDVSRTVPLIACRSRNNSL